MTLGRSDSAESGLERALSSFQQGMIAIGGTVGVGLFLGSGATIGLAGPAVVVTYGIAAFLTLVMGLVLAELATTHPVPGAFGVYADRYLGSWAGFVTRLTYWFAETLAVGAMVTAVGVYCSYWLPETPSYVFIAAAATLVVTVNVLHVGRFGLLDAILSLVKVSAIALFIVIGSTIVITDTGFDHLTSSGGFFPEGARGIWLSLTLVVASFLGVEAVAVTAGEAERPGESVPRALLGTVAALILLYCLSMLVIVTISPWNTISETSGTLTGSPFVKVLEEGGVPRAGSVMNLVVISAALTGAMSHLYLGTRMLYALATAGYVPNGLAVVDRRGVPLRALAGTTTGMIVALVLAARGAQVFLPMYGTGVAALLSIWILIFVCHLRFRRGRPGDTGRVPFHPWPSYLGIGILVAALSATPWVSGLEWTVPLLVIWIVFASALRAFSRRLNEPE